MKDIYECFHNPEEVFRVEFYFSIRNKRVEFYDKTSRSKNVEHFWADCYWPSYEQALLWRNSCQKVDSTSRAVVIDEAKLDRIKVTHMLEQWSFSDLEDNLRLNRTECGCEFCRLLKERNVLGITSALSESSVKLVFGTKLPIISQMIAEMNQIIGMVSKRTTIKNELLGNPSK